MTVPNAKNLGRNLCFAPDGVIYRYRETVPVLPFAKAVRDGGLSPSILNSEKNETVMAGCSHRRTREGYQVRAKGAAPGNSTLTLRGSLGYTIPLNNN